MKNITNIALSLCLVVIAAVAANAQAITTGTVDFSVSVPNAFDIRSNGTATTSMGMSATAQTANNQLGITLTVADASPNVNNATLTANVPIRLRSNTAYQLLATRSGSSTANAQDFDSSDIGMYINSFVRSGAQVAAGTDTPAGGWGAPGNNVAMLSGVGTQIVAGQRISNQGDNLSTNNYSTASLNFSIARQYYTPTVSPFLETVTVAIAAP